MSDHGQHSAQRGFPAEGVARPFHALGCLLLSFPSGLHLSSENTPVTTHSRRSAVLSSIFSAVIPDFGAFLSRVISGCLYLSRLLNAFLLYSHFSIIGTRQLLVIFISQSFRRF